MAYLNFISLLLETQWNTGFWGTMIGWFSGFIGNYGWTIVVFTICLKLVISPLDFWQRKVSRDNMDSQMKLAPEMAKLEKKYGDDKTTLRQKQAELYQNNGSNPVGSCFVMIISLALTMVIFFTLFTSLNTIASIKISNQYEKLEQKYDEVYTPTYESYVAEGKSEDESISLAENVASNAVKDYYDDKNSNLKESWLWIANIWKADTSTSVIPSFSEYKSLAKIVGSGNTNEEKATDLTNKENKYNLVMKSLSEEYSSRWNGYYILPILAGVVTFLSARFSNSKPKGDDKKSSEEAQAMQSSTKAMQFILPVIMVCFTLPYNALFSIYIVTNSLVSVALSPLFNLIINKLEDKKHNKSGSNGGQNSGSKSNKKYVTVGAPDYKIEKYVKH
jgi:YidC/Oxa1 family membrane protein insertase